MEIHDFQGGSAEVTLVYTLKSGQNAANVELWYVSDDGKTVETIPTECDGKTVRATVRHFSSYVIVNDPNGAQAAAEKSACPQDKTCPVSRFTDTDPKAWYHDGVHYVLENGIMNGMGGGVLAPNGTTSRAMMAQMLWNLEGKPADAGGTGFIDVDAGAWYAPAIRWASAEGIMGGVSEKQFAPEEAMTREQLVTIFYRYAGYKGVDVRTGGSLSAYTDAKSVSAWAADAMQWAVGTGLVNGTSADTLSPRGDATRAQVAAIMTRFVRGIR